ncbi:hypothetical protein [Nostoc sp. UIC 10630]|nr:hypothetical protein [Nostoc sp. UIC 10630]
MRRRYVYHRAEADLLAGTVMLLVVSLLLAIARLYAIDFEIKVKL